MLTCMTCLLLYLGFFRPPVSLARITRSPLNCNEFLVEMSGVYDHVLGGCWGAVEMEDWCFSDKIKLLRE